MKQLFCLLLLLSQAPLFLQAQSNYKPGYVINSKNDTLKGFVDYREWLKNPREINFKQTQAAATPQKFTVANANGFAITNAEYYDKFTVNISTSTVELAQLSHSPNTAYTTDTVFLQNLVNGKNVSLYAWTDNLKSSYYIFNKQTHTIEYLRQYLYFDEESRSVTGINGYISQLLRLAYQYLPGDTKIITRIQKANYAESDLTSAVIALNGGKATQQTVNSNSGVRFFAGTGLRYSKLQFNSSAGQAGPFSNGIHDNAISPVIAAGMDLLINKYTEKLLFRLEITGAVNSYHFSEASATNITTNALDVKVYHLSAVPQIMYNFYSTDKLKAFIDLGVAMNFYKYNNYNYTTTYHYSTITSVTAQNKYPDLQGFEFSIPVKAGVQINKRMEVYGAYWLPSSLSKYLYFSADQSAFQAGVNYIFR
ncbi:hypothetical protein [Mucilaginibacter lappiensis]|uniref:Outer membrane protein beta-barrel domain-containing protein n=1 Tax=Mucilaginibacter lappiensis TaxID=354630 RepID=A0A841JFV7_9SPHI|nr:hypothetical protein [Mucilaginibacter lappiensis]MBB6130033.1 hypothetical protein [Mucilaginibacter lappiensis]